MPRPRNDAQVTTQILEGGETTGGYFRRVFLENPKLLGTRSNDAVLKRWLADHPGATAMPANVQKHMSNVKSILRKQGRKKKGKPKIVEQDGAVQAVSTPPPTPVRIAPRGLEALEEQIDDCLTDAKHIDRTGLDEVIRLLRSARNRVVWKLGQ